LRRVRQRHTPRLRTSGPQRCHSRQPPLLLLHPELLLLLPPLTLRFTLRVLLGKHARSLLVMSPALLSIQHLLMLPSLALCFEMTVTSLHLLLRHVGTRTAGNVLGSRVSPLRKLHSRREPKLMHLVRLLLHWVHPLACWCGSRR